jgi:oligoribonuclease (3'-5' exoribonuclease)
MEDIRAISYYRIITVSILLEQMRRWNEQTNGDVVSIDENLVWLNVKQR